MMGPLREDKGGGEVWWGGVVNPIIAALIFYKPRKTIIGLRAM